ALDQPCGLLSFPEMTQRAGRDSCAMTVTGVVLVALLGCSPLPGDSLDPVSFARGGGTEAPSAEPPALSQARAAWAGPAASATTATLPAESRFPSRLATEDGADLLVGRYRDSRCEGDLTFSLW